jgi:hypothetical protein
MAVSPEDLQPLSSAQLGIWFESFLSDPKRCSIRSNEKWKTLNATAKVNTSQSNEASENQEF